MAQHEDLFSKIQYEPWPRRWREEYESREITFSIHDAANRTVATGELQEWRFNYDLTDEEADMCGALGIPTMDGFCIATDAWSTSAYEAAEIIRKFWFQRDEFEEHPLEYGGIVIFDKLNISAKSAQESAAVWELIERIMSRLRRKSSIIILKPFPLEYQGCITKQNRDRFLRRRKAMIRYYGVRLGAAVLGTSDQWMWIDTKSPLKPKIVRRRYRFDAISPAQAI